MARQGTERKEKERKGKVPHVTSTVEIMYLGLCTRAAVAAVSAQETRRATKDGGPVGCQVHRGTIFFLLLTRHARKALISLGIIPRSRRTPPLFHVVENTNRDAAVACLSSLLTRPDMEASHLRRFLEVCTGVGVVRLTL